MSSAAVVIAAFRVDIKLAPKINQHDMERRKLHLETGS